MSLIMWGLGWPSPTNSVRKSLLGVCLSLGLVANLAIAESDRKPPQLEPGPPGPAGPAGPPGMNAPTRSSWDAGVGADLRVWDSQHMTGTLSYKRDFVRPANSFYGVVGLRLGESHQDRQIESLKRKLGEITQLLVEQQKVTTGMQATTVGPEPIKAVIRGKD